MVSRISDNVQSFMSASYGLLFKQQPYSLETRNKDEVSANYEYWRMRTVIAMYLGYVFFYFTRKSFYMLKLFMAQDLSYSKSEIGLIATVLYITYGVSKFVSGVISDKTNPRYFMAAGLLLTAVCNILFGLSSSLFMFILLWGINGWFQGWGWHPITKQLTHWFSKSERGKWWSICGTSHNIGGALIPVLIVALIELFAGYSYNWRVAMIVPGVLSIFVSYIVFNRMRDIPQSLGLPKIEEYKNEPDEESKYIKPLTIKQILIDNVLFNKSVWMLGLSYFFVYIIRTVVNDWAIEFFVETKGYDFSIAARSVFWFEVGGFFGLLGAGWGSDKFFNGRRVPLMVLCAILLMFALPMLCIFNLGMFGNFFLFALVGALIFGPQMLVGIAAAEFVDKKAACTANGLAGTCACIGSAFAGYPVGVILETWGWNGVYVLLFASCLCLFLVLFPMLIGSNEERILAMRKKEESIASLKEAET